MVTMENRGAETSQQASEEYTSQELIDLLAADSELVECAKLDEETLGFLKDCEFADTLGFIYGWLLENGLDPDHHLERIGVFEQPA